MQDNTRDNRVLRGAMREAGFGAMDAIFAVLLLAAGVASLVAINQDKQEAAAEQVVVDRLSLEGQAANAFYRRNAEAIHTLAAQAKVNGRSYDAQAQASNPSLRFTTANFVQAGLLPATLQKDTAGRYSDSDGHIYATQVALHYAPDANGQPTTKVDGVWLLTYPDAIDPNRPLGFSDKDVGQYVAADPDHAGAIKAGRFVGVGGRIIKNLQQDFQLTLAGMVRPALIQPVAYLNNAGGGAGGGGGSSSGPLVAVRTPGTTVTVGGNGTTTVTTPIGSTTAGGGGVSTTTPTTTTTMPATPPGGVSTPVTGPVEVARAVRWTCYYRHGADDWQGPLGYVFYYDPAQPDKIGYKLLGFQKEGSPVTNPSGCGNGQREPNITEVPIIWTAMTMPSQTTEFGETAGQTVQVNINGSYTMNSGLNEYTTMYGGCKGKQCEYKIVVMTWSELVAGFLASAAGTITFTLP